MVADQRKTNRSMRAVSTAAGLLISLRIVGCASPEPTGVLDRLPEYTPERDALNTEWVDEEPIAIHGYDGDAMEPGISPDGRYLLFNDRNDPDKDMHWSERVGARTYRYGGRVENTVSDVVDGTPSFDGGGTLYFTTLKAFPGSARTIYRAGFADGAALDPTPVDGDIYVEGRNEPPAFWISLDPAITDDGALLFYSEGRFAPGTPVPYPFNVRAARSDGAAFRRLDDAVLAHVNTDNLEYAPEISADGLELFFTRIAKVDGVLTMVGVYAATRGSTDEPFGPPARIAAITGNVEAPVLSGDENHLYYHRLDAGVFRVYRVTRRQSPRPSADPDHFFPS